MRKRNWWDRFRGSRGGLVLNLVLMPGLIPASILWHGIPETIEGLRNFPDFVRAQWKETTWKF